MGSTIQDQAKIRFLHRWCREDPAGAEGGAELSSRGTFGAGCTKPQQQNQGCFITGLCWAESGILLPGDGAESDTVGKSLLRNLIQEQHKCGICLWPLTAQGSKAATQSFSPLHLFPSTSQSLLKLVQHRVV